MSFNETTINSRTLSLPWFDLCVASFRSPKLPLQGGQPVSVEDGILETGPRWVVTCHT